MITEFTLGPWLPEQSDYKNPGVEVAKNVIPSPKGYGPVYAMAGTGASVTGAIVGAQSFERSDGSIVTCVATESDLFTIVGGSVQAASLSLSLTAGDDHVSFERYGAEVYATAKNGDTWYLTDIDSDTTFAARGGNIPSANAMARVGDFLVMGDLDDGTDYPYRVQWSPYNNPGGTWGTDPGTQADYQDLDPQQGPLIAMSGGSFGMVFQKNGISRMQYVGGAAIFAFEIYERNRGCVAPLSVARVGDVAYFLSYDGFFSTDGASTENIGRGRVWEWFLDNVDQAYLSNITAAIDWEKRCVVWFCVKSGTGALSHNIRLCFNWETGGWSYVEESASFGVLANRGTATTLEALAVTYPNIDAMTISLDSEIFRASGSTLGMFVSGELSTGTGTTLAANWQTGSLQPKHGHRTFIRAVTPLIANGGENTMIAVGYRDGMVPGYSTSPTATVGPLGFSAHNVSGRYFRLDMTIPAGQDWQDAYGVQVEYDVEGPF